MDNSSVMYATILSGPPQPLHTSGSAWNTLLMSRAQLGGQRLFVGAAFAASCEPSFSLRKARTRQCSLAGGTLEGTTVTRPCHGSQFDVTTGAVLRPPAVQPVRSYRVQVEGDTLKIEA